MAESYRVPKSEKSLAIFATGAHVFVDASGEKSGRYFAGLLVLVDGVVVDTQKFALKAQTSVLAEIEAIEFAFKQFPNHIIWNYCIPAIEAVLKRHANCAPALYWPPPSLRKPYFDRAHELSQAAWLNTPSQHI